MRGTFSARPKKIERLCMLRARYIGNAVTSRRKRRCGRGYRRYQIGNGAVTRGQRAVTSGHMRRTQSLPSGYPPGRALRPSPPPGHSAPLGRLESTWPAQATTGAGKSRWPSACVYGALGPERCIEGSAQAAASLPGPLSPGRCSVRIAALEWPPGRARGDAAQRAPAGAAPRERQARLPLPGKILARVFLRLTPSARATTFNLSPGDTAQH